MCETDYRLNFLLENNKNWVANQLTKDPTFFDKLSSIHAPKYLWIGCSDARVPANTIIGLAPGEVFVHRNVGNVVAHSDVNVQAVITYAVRFLKVKHVIVTGHYDCGAVKATLGGKQNGRMEPWLYHLRDVIRENNDALQNLNGVAQVNALCELNVKTQARHVAESSAITEAWAEGQDVTIHGWIYSVKDGLLKNLGCTLKSADDIRSLEQSNILKKM